MHGTARRSACLTEDMREGATAVRHCHSDQVSYSGSVATMRGNGQILNIYVNVELEFPGGLLRDFKRKRGAKVASTFNNSSM